MEALQILPVTGIPVLETAKKEIPNPGLIGKYLDLVYDTFGLKRFKVIPELLAPSQYSWLIKIRENPTRHPDLIQEVEIALSRIRPNWQSAIRLRYALDDPNNQWVSYKEVGIMVYEGRKISPERARRMVTDGQGALRRISRKNSIYGFSY